MPSATTSASRVIVYAQSRHGAAGELRQRGVALDQAIDMVRRVILRLAGVMVGDARGQRRATA